MLRSRPVAVASLAVLGALALQASPGARSRAHAQQSGGAALILTADLDAVAARRSDAWTRRVSLALTRSGAAVIPALEPWAIARTEAAGSIEPRRLEALSQVESDLVEARVDAAHLREGAALRRLVSAERVLEANMDLPGVAEFYAEVETAIGLVAAQAGLAELSRAALVRAVGVDPSRGVRAAEAAPSVVAQANALARAVATGPTGSFEVSTDAPDGRVFIDDVALGGAPTVVRTTVGPHVIRVEAPGRKPWGSLVSVLEGVRAPVHVRLSVDPLVVAARDVERAAAARDAASMRAALGHVAEHDATLDAVWLLEVGAGPRDRALLTPCGVTGCGASLRLDRGRSLDTIAAATSRTRDARVAREDRTWLRAPWVAPPPPPPPTLWQRWYFWAGSVAGAGLIAAGITGLALALRPAQEHAPLHLVIDGP